MIRSGRASERLERALAAAGSATPRSFGDEANRASDAATPQQHQQRKPTAGREAYTAPAAPAAPAADTDDLFLDDGGPEDQPQEALPGTDMLKERRRDLEERLETLQNDSIKTRSLLRDVEAMVQRAIEDAPALEDEDDLKVTSVAPSRATSAVPSPRGTATTGARLPLSRMTPRPGVGAAVSAAAATVAAARGRTAASSSYGAPTADEPDADDASDALRQRRLVRCEQMQAALQPMRRDLDEYASSLGDAHAGNERLQTALSSALTFSDEDIARELAAQALEERPPEEASVLSGAGPAPPPPPPLPIVAVGLRAAVGGQPQPRRATAAEKMMARVAVAETLRPTSASSSAGSAASGRGAGRGRPPGAPGRGASERASVA